MPGIQAPISHGGDAHDYVISHRTDQHTVSFRPAGRHEHVGTFSTEKAAKGAAAAHAQAVKAAAATHTQSALKAKAAKAAVATTQAQPPRKTTTARKRSTPPAQLEREIAESLRTSGQPQIASMFGDPEATRVFAREMRHELTKKQLAKEGAERLAARPYTVKRLELMGKRRVRSLLGRYATEAEARSRADAVDGWIEYGGRVIYGVEKQSDPDPGETT